MSRNKDNLDPRVKRQELTKQMAINAATKPTNVAVPAVMALVAGATGMAWLWPLAAVIYVLLSVTTFFNEEEMDRVKAEHFPTVETPEAGERFDLSSLPAPVRERMSAALDKERRIRADIDRANLGFEEVTGEVDNLMDDLYRTAQQANIIVGFLKDQDARSIGSQLAKLRMQDQNGEASGTTRSMIESLEDQLRVVRGMESKLQRFYEQMDLVVVELGTIHAHFIEMSVADEERAQEQIAGRLRELREQMGGISSEMQSISSATM